MADIVRIDDPDDPRIAPYLALRDKDLAGHGGRFVCEGESVIKVLLTESRYPVESLLLAETRLAALAPLLERCAAPVHVAPAALMDRIVGFPIHRGMLAMARRGAPLDPDALLADRPGLIVALSGVANHDNVGGIFRNAAAFGVGAVLIDRATCDPLYRKAVRVSVGGVLRVPFARIDDPMDLVRRLGAAGRRVIGLSPRGRTRLDEVPRDGSCALVLGAEGPGLPDAVMDAVETVRIDMAGGFDSLNVATTSGIALYELTREARGRP